MTCPYLISGRCGLAEKLALQIIEEDIQCPVAEDSCAKCQAAGGPDAARVPIACLTTAKGQIPKGKRVAWARFTVGNHYGAERKKRGTTPKEQPKGVGDFFAETLRNRHGADAYGGCDCNALKVEMNALGPNGCERDAERLAKRVTQNLNNSGRWQKMLPEWIKEAYFRVLIADAVAAVRELRSQNSANSE